MYISIIILIITIIIIIIIIIELNCFVKIPIMLLFLYDNSIFLVMSINKTA